jgi:hypothetical protein
MKDRYDDGAAGDPGADRTERILGESLSTMDIPPSTLDVSDLVRLGRRRVRRRRHATTGMVAALTLVAVAAPVGLVQWHNRVSPTASTPVSAEPDSSAPSTPTAVAAPCTATTVTLPKSGKAYTADIGAMDPSGRYLVSGPHTSTAPILWDNLHPRYLAAPGPAAAAIAVNAAGTVVGTTTGSKELSSGWIYRDGEIRYLPAPAGYPLLVAPVDINAAGDVVGIGQSKAAQNIVPVLWPAEATAKVHPLTLPDSAPAGVIDVAIGDDGTVAATLVGKIASIPYRWLADGTGQELAIPNGAQGGMVKAIRGTWAFGSVYLDANTAGREPRTTADPDQKFGYFPTPARWDLRTGEVKLLDQAVRGIAVTGNAAGDMVVQVIRGDGTADVLYRGGRPVTLETATSSGVAQPAAVSDSGRLVAGNDIVERGGQVVLRQPTMWRC